MIVPNSEICGICDKPGASLKCVADCKRFYHKECTDKMAIKTVTQAEDGEIFIQCENCLARIQKCQHCQQQGQMGQQMQKCAVSSCTYFFHKRCQDQSCKDLPESIREQLKTPVFICGAHHCHGCSQPFRMDESVLRCLKCVTAYHEGCTKDQKIQQITQKQFICQSHNLSEINSKIYLFTDSKGDQLTRFSSKADNEPKGEDNSDEQADTANDMSQVYKRMRTGLN